MSSIQPAAPNKFTRYSSRVMHLPQEMSLHEGERFINYELRAVKDPQAGHIRFASRDTVGGYLFSWSENGIFPTQTVAINTTDQKKANEVVIEALNEFESKSCKLSPLEIMHWLRWRSKCSGLLGWYPQHLNPLPKPRPFVFAMSKSFDMGDGYFINLQVRAIKDPDDSDGSSEAATEDNVGGYMLTYSSNFSPDDEHSCTIRTADPEIVQEIFNYTISELERNPNYTGNSIINHLVIRSPYSTLKSRLPSNVDFHFFNLITF